VLSWWGVGVVHDGRVVGTWGHFRLRSKARRKAGEFAAAEPAGDIEYRVVRRTSQHSPDWGVPPVGESDGGRGSR
jgi:hypothetical protein